MGIVSGIAAVFTAVGASAATATALATAVVQIGAGTIISAVSRAVFGGRTKQPKAQELARELSQPTALPTYRHVYGHTRATGTPINTPVDGPYIYGVWLLNSRPSDMSEFRLFLDKREVRFHNPEELFNLSGPGARGRNEQFADHVWAWVGRGDQTSPPAGFLAEVPYTESEPEGYKPTDAWRGRTVIWLRLKAGKNEERQERWPSAPPIVEVEGRWSKIWDPRDAAQDAGNPATWKWSANHALCVMDALRQNPMRRYRDISLHLDSFTEGADICDATIQRKDGSAERRYRAAGTLTYERGELEDAVNPLVLSGAANLVRIGAALGYQPGIWQEPDVTLNTFLGEGFAFSDMAPGPEMVNELRVAYLSDVRGYETAELQPWAIPGALAEDGGLPAPRDVELSFCPSSGQAMRVRKIIGLRLRRQESLSEVMLPPEAFDLVPGASAHVRLPEPYDALDGMYEIQSIHPCLDPSGKDGVALRQPASLIKTGPEIYAWTPAEEEDVVTMAYDGTRRGVQPPGPLAADADNLDTGDTIIPRLRISFFPSTSGGVDSYEMQIRVHIEGQSPDAGWGQKIQIDPNVRDGDGRVYGLTEALSSSKTYDVRVRTVAAAGASSYRELSGVPAEGVDVTLNPPLAVEPFEVTASEIEAAFRTRNEPDTRAVEIYGADTDDVGVASLLGSPIYTGANATVSITETGLSSGQTRYYFARTLGPFGTTSDFTAGIAATTT